MGRDDAGSRTRASIVRVPVEGWTPGTVAFGDELDVTFATTFDAPRILNDPVRCRFSAFSRTSRPVSRESVSEP